MPRHVIHETDYVFSPTTRTITVPGIIPRERFVIITNVTTNQVLYNFSDTSLGFESHTYVQPTDNSTQAKTVIVVEYNTVGMSATDKIQIVLDEFNSTFNPSEMLMDPVNKLRTSSPQALIDTDFEYSRQDTKWESIALINGRPFAYANIAAPLTITTLNATANGSRQVILTPNNSLAVGTPIYIFDTAWTGACDGTFMIETANSTAVTFSARSAFPNTASANLVGINTIGYAGVVYSGANIGISAISTSGNAVTVNTAAVHGLSIGNEISMYGITGTNPPNGTFYISTVPSSNSFVYYVNATPSGLTTTGAVLYPRPSGYVNHRPFDGGVRFSTFSESHGQQLIRQTRRYFRYQSGKGVQISTGTILKPELTIDNMTASGTTITVTTKEPHCIFTGAMIRISGAEQSAYNGDFEVDSVLDTYTFTYFANSIPSSSPATGDYRLSVTAWDGASARVGMFDDQNGLFFEFDGDLLYAVRRTATYQLSGQATVINGSTTVTGSTSAINKSATRFSGQLVPGDTVVIRGMTHRVVDVASDTQFSISPPYRGTTVTAPQFVNITKVIDTRIPQSLWNMDKCDGTGPSGYNIDLTRMQMFYIDYSWYGAGFIRWGVRATDGNVIYVHKVVNNNLNFEAYMRSGNLPARYETNTLARYTELTSTLDSAETQTINVANTLYWPSSGTVWIRNATQSEFINYTGRSNTTITGLTRTGSGATLTVGATAGSPLLTAVSTSGVQVGQFVNAAGIPPGAYVVDIIPNTSIELSIAAITTNASLSAQFAPMGQSSAQTFTFSATAPTQVQLHAPSFSPTISHWGTSVIMDGRFDDDKSFVFTQGMTTSLSVSSGATNALMSFRVAPTASNGIPGSQLGVREIINRMQMVLRQLDLLSGGQFLITLVLNGRVSSATPNWSNVGGSSLAQYINHTSATTISGGEVIFGFFTNAAGGSNFTSTSVDLPLVRDLGNSILGGGTAASNTQFYPDGPDMVTVMARNVGGASANVFARMSWTEAQA